MRRAAAIFAFLLSVTCFSTCAARVAPEKGRALKDYWKQEVHGHSSAGINVELAEAAPSPEEVEYKYASAIYAGDGYGQYGLYSDTTNDEALYKLYGLIKSDDDRDILKKEYWDDDDSEYFHYSTDYSD